MLNEKAKQDIKQDFFRAKDDLEKVLAQRVGVSSENRKILLHILQETYTIGKQVAQLVSTVPEGSDDDDNTLYDALYDAISLFGATAGVMEVCEVESHHGKSHYAKPAYEKMVEYLEGKTTLFDKPQGSEKPVDGSERNCWGE